MRIDTRNTEVGRRIGARNAAVARRIGALLALGLAVAAAAAAQDGGALAPAELSFEVWRGATAAPPLPTGTAAPVTMVVDLSRSMREKQDDGAMYLYGAREAAALLVERLPARTTLAVDVIGVSRQQACADATRVAAGSVAGLRGALPTRLRGLGPSGEGSLARTLEKLAAGRAGAGDQARVVAFSDLEDGCGGDLCAAARALVATGASLELVLFGPKPAPACLADLTAPDSVPASAGAVPAPPGIRVEEVEGGAVRARVPGDGSRVAFPAGPAKLVVEGTPAVTFGPLELAPGTRTRVQLLDFPREDPPLREWRWKVQRPPPGGWPDAP